MNNVTTPPFLQTSTRGPFGIDYSTTDDLIFKTFVIPCANLPLPTATITSDLTALCSTGERASFKVTWAGVFPTGFKWYRNGVLTDNAQQINAYVNPVSVSDTITCELITDDPCFQNTTIRSNPIIIKLKNPPPSVSIAANSTQFCAGTSVRFTTTVTNPGTTVSYEWFNTPRYGTSVISRANSLISTDFMDGDVVTCAMISQDSCGLTRRVTSNPIALKVTNTVTPSVSIAASTTTICAGSPVSFTPTPTNGGTTPTYIWKKNGVNAASTATYTSSNFANGDDITCEMTSNATCITATKALSNSVKMIVNAIVTPSVSIAASATTICSGTSVSFTSTPTNGGTTPTFIWKKNSLNVATTPTYTSVDLINGDVITCQMSSNATCVSTPTVTSTSITMTVNALPSVFITANKTVLCLGDTATLTASTGATYKWSNTQTSKAIRVTPSVTTTYNVSVTDNNGCTGSFNQIISVNPRPKADFSFIVSGATVRFTNLSTGETTYNWIFKNNTTSTNASPTATYPTNGTYNVCLFVGNSFSCRDSICKDINVTRVAVDDLPNGLTFTIGPNPTLDKLNIDLYFNQPFKDTDKLVVSDLLGKTVNVFNNLTNHNELDLSSIASGIYTIQIVINNKVYHLDKVVKMGK